MNVNTLSDNSRKSVLHTAVILAMLSAAILIMSAHTYAASGVKGSGQINGADGVNLRESASTSSGSIAVLRDNTRLKIYREVFKSKTSKSKKKIWYYVKANGMKGYVRADCVDNVKYNTVAAKVKTAVTVRKGPGTKMKKVGSLSKGEKVTVYLDARPVKSTRGSSKTWYKIKYNGKYRYVCSKYIKITGTPTTDVQPSQDQVSQVVSVTSNAFSKMTEKQFENYLSNQGFPEAYKKSLRTLHKKHPNWVFVAYKTGLSWNDVLEKQTKNGVSLVHKSYPSSYRSKAKNATKQVEPGWYNASATVVAYYMDPRNFINEDRIYMFEDLAYQSEYQTTSVVSKIIAGTKLSSYGFTAKVFMNAGKKYKISPVFLAARVRQETGGNSDSVNGSKSGGTVVYNPFNIGATGSNPVASGLAYAKKKGWTTPAKAVDGGASYLASGYISKKQNTIYFQRFNVANGITKAGTHQYMTNVMAPYSEAYITKSSYTKFGIANEPLGFIIPVYKSMPSKTKLP